MKKFIVLAIIALGAGFSACKKEKEVFPNQSEMTTITPPPDQGDSIVDQTKASWILNATSASQIPSQFFRVATKYKTSYVHLKMRTYGTTPYGECSWTSYVIAAACVAKANGYSYSVNLPQVDIVKNACKNHAGGSLANGALITNLEWYANNQDYSKISVNRPNIGTTRFTAIKEMLNHINTYHTPFLVVSSVNGGGHYRIVHSIDWKVGGTGSTVYYTDCLTIGSNSSIDANLKSMNFTDFLNSMIAATSCYNVLFIRPN